MELNLKSFVFAATVDKQFVRLTLEGEGGGPVNVVMRSGDFLTFVQKLQDFGTRENLRGA